MTDKEIIEHLRNNKYQKATNGLYNILPLVKKYISANSGTSDDAKDIFQDALVILYKNVQTESFTLSAPLKTYLLAVTKNLWLQELRRRNKMPVSNEQIDIPEAVPAEEKDFNLATAAFYLLGERCRHLLILFYFKKKTYRELASFLGFGDERTAKNQKYRCLQKAKENYLTLSKSSHEK
jgi:RNA polymerase sigma factor (sigma-70 family)